METKSGIHAHTNLFKIYLHFVVIADFYKKMNVTNVGKLSNTNLVELIYHII